MSCYCWIFLVLVRFRVLFLFHLSLPLRLPPLPLPLLLTQGSCAADLYRHPQLDADIEAVKEIYSENSVSIREYGTIDDVDIDLHINISFLDEEVSTAWKVLRTEPIVLRLRFSLSQYLDGPESWVCSHPNNGNISATIF